MHLFRANTGYGFRCLKCKIAKLWKELDTELKEETSPTQFKSLLKLVLMTKLYSDYWFVTASYILYYGWCLCRSVLIFFLHYALFCYFFAIFCFFLQFCICSLQSLPTINSQLWWSLDFLACLSCIYIFVRGFVLKLNMTDWLIDWLILPAFQH